MAFWGSFLAVLRSLVAVMKLLLVVLRLRVPSPQWFLSRTDFTRFNPYRNPRTIPTPLLIWCLGGEEFLGLLPC